MKRIVVVGGLIAASALLSGCASGGMVSDSDSGSRQVTNEDPRHGWVEVQPYDSTDSNVNDPTTEIAIWKYCDGPTLMYVTRDYTWSASVSAVPNSPECVG